ncbi:MAG: CxxC-x17-CxxC domain-containing protein [Patescibacteria group bacterium]
MRNYSNDDRGGWKPKKSFGGGRSFGGDRDFGGDREKPEMHQTVCSDCGDECEVPFKPNGRKPVFCRSCFKKDDFEEGSNDRRNNGFERNDRGSDRGERRDFDRPRYEEKPRFEKPQASENYKAQFEMLNFKMDLIIKALQQMGMSTSALKPVKEAKIEKEMPKEEMKKEVAPKAAKATKSESEGPELSKPIKIVRKKKAA